MNGTTAWERWELASLDAEPPTPTVATAPAPEALDRETIERICAKARRDGHREGYAAGREDARREAARLGQAAAELERALTEFDQQVADELLALAVEIARQVVRGEIGARCETILTVVREALAQLPHQHATIYLHPDDASLVRSHAGDVLAHAGHRILDEPRLKPGDCVLESGASQVDASLATRWRRVIESMGMKSAWETAERP
jgi:flagellar assembly protein FliH